MISNVIEKSPLRLLEEYKSQDLFNIISYHLGFIFFFWEQKKNDSNKSSFERGDRIQRDRSMELILFFVNYFQSF